MTRREGGQEVCTGRLLCEHLSGSAHDPLCSLAPWRALTPWSLVPV